MAYPDFEEFIASLNDEGAKYLIVGAYALAFHVRPRATKVLDILVAPTASNAARVRSALTRFFGTAVPGITVKKLTNPRTLIVLGVAPVRIDLLTSIAGVPSFAAAWKARVERRFGKVPAHYLSMDDLIRAKQSAGRPQGLADLDVLRRAARARARRRTPARKKGQ